MRILNQICLSIFLFAKQVWHFPRSIVDAIKAKRRWLAQKDIEAERLDRIRNPSKYLGK
jgi:hypothetical protein